MSRLRSLLAWVFFVPLVLVACYTFDMLPVYKALFILVYAAIMAYVWPLRKVNTNGRT